MVACPFELDCDHFNFFPSFPRRFTRLPTAARTLELPGPAPAFSHERYLLGDDEAAHLLAFNRSTCRRSLLSSAWAITSTPRDEISLQQRSSRSSPSFTFSPVRRDIGDSVRLVRRDPSRYGFFFCDFFSRGSMIASCSLETRCLRGLEIRVEWISSVSSRSR